MSNELSAQDLLPPEIGLTLLGFEKIRARLARPSRRPHSLGVPFVQNTVDRSPQSLLEATARSSGSRQAGGAAIAVESMAMPAELGAAHHRRDKLPTASFVGLRRVDEFHFTSFACQFWGSVNLIVISLRMGMGFPFNSSGV